MFLKIIVGFLELIFGEIEVNGKFVIGLGLDCVFVF